MRDNKAFKVYGCGASTLAKPDFGRITQHGNRLYFHVFDALISHLPLPGVRAEDIKAVRLLSTGQELSIKPNWITGNYPDICFVSMGPDPIPPDWTDTVVMVELKG